MVAAVGGNATVGGCDANVMSTRGFLMRTRHWYPAVPPFQSISMLLLFALDGTAPAFGSEWHMMSGVTLQTACSGFSVVRKREKKRKKEKKESAKMLRRVLRTRLITQIICLADDGYLNTLRSRAVQLYTGCLRMRICYAKVLLPTHNQLIPPTAWSVQQQCHLSLTHFSWITPSLLMALGGVMILF